MKYRGAMAHPEGFGVTADIRDCLRMLAQSAIAETLEYQALRGRDVHTVGCEGHIPQVGLRVSRSGGLPSRISLPDAVGLRRRWRGVELGALYIRNGHARLLRGGLGSRSQSQYPHSPCLRPAGRGRYVVALET